MSKILTKHLIGSSQVSYVDAPLISVPNTQIANRALIKDPSQDMKASLGVDRIICQQAVEVPGEFGPSGERVLKFYNDERDLVRFVGGWVNITDTSGQRVSPTLSGDFIEVTFYGTGLNVLIIAYSSAGDLRATVDGGVEGANLLSSYSNVILSRNYSTNQIVPVVSGLALGLHTVKLRVASPTPNIYGFDILTEASQIRIPSGAVVKDQKRFTLPSVQNLSYDPGVGSKGGRVILYSYGGTIAQSYQSVDATQKNISLADHTNEEIARIYHFREFGAGRSDDFSTLSTSSTTRAFTLDDGTTTLTGFNTQIYSGYKEGPSFNGSAGDYIAITFVGTGLDWIEGRGLATISNFSTTAVNVTVDGTSIGSGTLTSFGWTPGSRNKVVSGLPYGTHVVKFALTASGNLPNMTQFVVYQPKKPTLPTGAVEIADYNVMATYVANTVAGVDTIATGVLRKMISLREATFVGTWSISGTPTDTGIISQFATSTSTNGDSVQFTFWGTGFEYRGRTAATRSNNISVTLNGLAATTANFPSLVSSVYGGPAFASGTLNMNAATQDAAGLRISGLPLGKYTVKFTNNTANLFSVDGFDVITPVHAYKYNQQQEVQNTLNIGSQSIRDSRQIVPFTETKKFRGTAIGISSNPSTSSTSYVPIPDLSLTVESKGAWFELIININLQQSGANNTFINFFINGVLSPAADQTHANSVEQNCNNSAIVYLAPGVHKIDAVWRCQAGTSNTNTLKRQLTVKEL